MSIWNVRSGTLADIEFLVECGKRLAYDTEGKVLDHETVTKGVTDMLDQPKLGCYYVAEDESGNKLGTTMTTYELSLALGGQVTWIQSVFVCPEARGKGCFRAIYEHIVKQA